MAKSNSVTLRLKTGERLLAALDLDEGVEAYAGRSHGCQLQTPADDHSVSGRHAHFFWKGHALHVEDAGSRNGIYLKGKRLTKPVKVDPSAIYALGNCQITAFVRKEEGRESVARHHRLEFLNGDRAKELVDVAPKPGADAFTIGLDPACDVCLPDMLVSRRHVTLSVKPNGECWIADAGSRNGTFVNKEPLRAKERLLKDGDVISIAYFDLKFLDRDVSHTRSFLGAKLGVIALTALVLGLGYFVWRNYVEKPVDHYLRVAEAAAHNENFDTARTAIKDAEAAPGAGDVKNRIRLSTLGEQIRRWSDVHGGWADARAMLADGRMERARTVLNDVLGPDKRDAWNWNEAAMTALDDAKFAVRLVNLANDARNEVAKVIEGRLERDAVAKAIAAGDRFLADEAAKLAARDYLADARKRLSDALAQLKELSGGMMRVDAAIVSVDLKDPLFDKAVAELESIAADEKYPAGIRALANAELPVCRQFVAARRFIEGEKARVRALEFKELLLEKERFPLPGQSVCARHVKFSDARAVYQKLHEDCLREAETLAPMVRNMVGAGIQAGRRGAVLDYLASGANWNKALAFDCFGAVFPRASRLEPTSAYDELFGIEYARENLRNLPKPPTRGTLISLNFVPKCLLALGLYRQVDTFATCLERAEGRDYRSGKMGELYEQAKRIQKERGILVEKMRGLRGDLSGAGVDRSRILAGYYAEYFAVEPSAANLQQLEAAFKKLEQEVNRLNEVYESEGDPEKRLLLKKKILAKGIPGNEAVRKRWVESED